MPIYWFFDRALKEPLNINGQPWSRWRSLVLEVAPSATSRPPPLLPFISNLLSPHICTPLKQIDHSHIHDDDTIGINQVSLSWESIQQAPHQNISGNVSSRLISFIVRKGTAETLSLVGPYRRGAPRFWQKHRSLIHQTLKNTSGTTALPRTLARGANSLRGGHSLHNNRRHVNKCLSGRYCSRYIVRQS